MHVHVHSVSGFVIYRLRHESSSLSFLRSLVFDYVFREHGLVSHLGQVSELNFDLALTRSSDLVMVILDFDAVIFHDRGNSAPEVVQFILRRRSVVSAFVWHLVSEVSLSRHVFAAVPLCLL